MLWMSDLGCVVSNGRVAHTVMLTWRPQVAEQRKCSLKIGSYAGSSVVATKETQSWQNTQVHVDVELILIMIKLKRRIRLIMG